MDKCTEIEYLKKQFLCGIPVRDVKWPKLIDPMSVEDQKIILDETVESELVKKFPLKLEYQRHFLKNFIHILEGQGTEIEESVLASYFRLWELLTSSSKHSNNFKHYLCKNFTISLEESTYLISDGTTGLRTWQAALALAEWIMQNKSFIKDKLVLELGSGIGLTGLTAILECSPKCYIFTDCHSLVLNTLLSNIELNIKNLIEENCENSIKNLIKKSWTGENEMTVKVFDMPWEDVDEDTCKKIGKLDIVFAADVVYDDSIFNPLISAMKLLSVYCEVGHFFFCCTERSEETLEKFLRSIMENNFELEQLQIPEQKNYVWSTESPIRLFDIKPIKQL